MKKLHWLVSFAVILLVSCQKEMQIIESESTIQLSCLEGNEKVYRARPLKNGNTVLIGHRKNDAFVMVQNPQGSIVWEQKLANKGYNEFYDVIELKDGGIVAVGCSNGAVLNTDRGSLAGIIVKYSANGNHEWTALGEDDRGSEPLDEKLFCIIEDKDGNLVCGGEATSYYSFLVKLDPLGKVQRISRLKIGGYFNSCNALSQDDDGNYIAVGVNSVSSLVTEIREMRTYMAKIQKNALTKIWSNDALTLGRDPWLFDAQYNIDLLARDNGYVLANSFESRQDDHTYIQVIETDKSGVLIQEKSFHGKNNGHASMTQFIEDEDGGYLLCGKSGIPGKTGFYYMAMKINHQFEEEWVSYQGTQFRIQSASCIQKYGGNWVVHGTVINQQNGLGCFSAFELNRNGQLIENK